jgi:hypothetical protein
MGISRWSVDALIPYHKQTQIIQEDIDGFHTLNRQLIFVYIDLTVTKTCHYTEFHSHLNTNYIFYLHLALSLCSFTF